MSRLVKNTAFNFSTQIISSVAALVCIPIAFRHLGVERFGLLTLAWSLLSYTILFDLGTGPAVARGVSASIAQDNGSRIRAILRAAALIQLSLGLIGALLIVGLTPHLLDWLNIPPVYRADGRLTLYALALAVPVVLLSQSQTAVLEAMERFDIVAYVRAPTALATYVVPAIGALAGWSIAAVIFIIVCTRILALGVLSAAHAGAVPANQHGVVRDEALALFRFSRWLAISVTIAQVMSYLDRFMLSNMHGLAAVAQYGAPYDAASKMLALPASVGNAMFPGMTRDAALDQHAAALQRSRKAAGAMLLLIAPLCIIAVMLAGWFLELWLGPQIQAEGIAAFRILIVAMAFHAVAYPPIYAIEAFGRADAVARYHVVELVLYLPAAIALIMRFGVVGAAAAWALRGLALMVWSHTYAGRWK
jgi:O-antigen/teichoic acid export membrane protein